MNTKDAVKYIKSKAMREHLQKVGYEPSVLEAAYFIMNTVRERTFAEQKLLLLDLILENEDAAVDGDGDSAAALVCEYIEKTEAFIKEFESAAFGEYYMFQWKTDDPDEEFGLCPEYNAIYSSFKQCIDAAFEDYYKSGMDFFDDIFATKTLKIIKRRVNDSDFCKIAFYKTGMDILAEETTEFCHICDREDDIRLFGHPDFLLDLPHPFEPGDIVRYVYESDWPFVLVNMPNKYYPHFTGVYAHWNVVYWQMHVSGFSIRPLSFLLNSDYYEDLENKDQVLNPIAKRVRGEWPKEVARYELERMENDNLERFFDDLIWHSDINKLKENPKD